MDMLKKIGSELYTRVFKAYISTFIGLAVLAADVVIQTLSGSNVTWVHAVAGVAAALLALYKPAAKVLEPG